MMCFISERSNFPPPTLHGFPPRPNVRELSTTAWTKHAPSKRVVGCCRFFPRHVGVVTCKLCKLQNALSESFCYVCVRLAVARFRCLPAGVKCTKSKVKLLFLSYSSLVCSVTAQSLLSLPNHGHRCGLQQRPSGKLPPLEPLSWRLPRPEASCELGEEGQLVATREPVHVPG